MPTIRDNGDGTFTITDDQGNQSIRRPGDGDEAPAPQQPGTQTPDEPRAGVIDHNEVRRLQEQYAILVNEGNEAEGFLDVRAALIGAGLSGEEANAALTEVSNNPTGFTPVVSDPNTAGFSEANAAQNALRDQGRSRAEQAALVASQVNFPASTGGAAGAAAGDDGFGFLGPDERAFQFQETRAGRGQLFNEFIAQNLPDFGGGIAQRAAQSRFNPFSVSFNLGQALQPSFDQNFSFLGGLGGNAPTGSQIGDQLGALLSLVGGGGQLNDPALGFLGQLSDEDFIGQGRDIAFNTANATAGLGLGNPFRDTFSSILGRRLDRFLGQGGTSLDFLNQFQTGGLGSF